MPPDEPAYRDNLAWIHDTGFGSFATHAARLLRAELRRSDRASGQIVELGSGSGISSAILSKAGYDVLGYDISAAMVKLARRRAPQARFRQASFLSAELPPCIAVTAIGEVFNYLFDRNNSHQQLSKLFRRIHDALLPGGLFLFDGSEPGRVTRNGRRRYGVEGDGWACLVDAEENRDTRILTRRITSFRQVGELFRRDYEVHRQRLFDRRELVTDLRKIGFRVRMLRGYGQLKFPRGYVGFLARKQT